MGLKSPDAPAWRTISVTVILRMTVSGISVPTVMGSLPAIGLPLALYWFTCFDRRVTSSDAQGTLFVAPFDGADHEGHRSATPTLLFEHLRCHVVPEQGLTDPRGRTVEYEVHFAVQYITKVKFEPVRELHRRRVPMHDGYWKRWWDHRVGLPPDVALRSERLGELAHLASLDRQLEDRFLGHTTTPS